MGTNCSFLCKHEQMTMQILETTSTKWQEYALFECESCGLHCYRKRALGRIYHGAWEPGAFSVGIECDKKKEVFGNKVITGLKYAICWHSNLSTPHTSGYSHTSRRKQEFEPELAQFYCTNCNMNCICESTKPNIWEFKTKGSFGCNQDRSRNVIHKNAMPWPWFRFRMPSHILMSRNGMKFEMLLKWYENNIDWNICHLSLEKPCNTHLFFENGTKCEHTQCFYKHIPNILDVQQASKKGTFTALCLQKQTSDVLCLQQASHCTTPKVCSVQQISHTNQAVFIHTENMPIGYYVKLDHTYCYPVAYLQPADGWWVECVINLKDIVLFQQKQLSCHIQVNVVLELITEYALSPAAFLQRNISSHHELLDDKIAQKYPKWAVEHARLNQARHLKYILDDKQRLQEFLSHEDINNILDGIAILEPIHRAKHILSTLKRKHAFEICARIEKYAPLLCAPFIRLRKDEEYSSP